MRKLAWVLGSALAITAAWGDGIPAFVYHVPPLIPAMAKMAKEQAVVNRPINLVSADRDSSRIIVQDVRWVESKVENGKSVTVLRDFTFEEKRQVNAAIKSAFAGQIPPQLSESEGNLFYLDKQLSLTFSIQGQISAIGNNKEWTEVLLKQFRENIRTPRLEDLSVTPSKRDVLFGFLIGGEPVVDKEESRVFSEKLKPIFAADEISDEFSVDENLNLLYQPPLSLTAKPVQIFLYAYDPVTKETLGLDAVEFREMNYRWQRHLAEVLKRRGQRRESLTPPPFEKLSGPKVVEVAPGEPIYAPELKEAKDYLATIPQWNTLMNFFRTVSPAFHSRIETQVKNSKLRFDPIDSFSTAELKVNNPQRLLDKELVQNEGGVIVIANNLYGKKNTTEKAYLILYGLLLGINGISPEGAFDFTCKIKMITQYEKKSEIPVAEFEGYVFQMMTNEEIEEAKSWQRKISLMRKNPGANPKKPSAAGKVITEGFAELENDLKKVWTQKTSEQFERVFGSLPQSTR